MTTDSTDDSVAARNTRPRAGTSGGRKSPSALNGQKRQTTRKRAMSAPGLADAPNLADVSPIETQPNQSPPTSGTRVTARSASDGTLRQRRQGRADKQAAESQPETAHFAQDQDEQDDGDEALSAPVDPNHFAAGPIDPLSAEEQSLFSRTTRWSFVALVLAPFLAACFYLLAIAADRYAVEVKFAVRSPNGGPTADLVGIVTGGAAGSTKSDSYMVVEYLQSRQFLDELSTRLNLPSIYAIDSADPLMRLATDASKEDQVDYLSWVVRPSFDATADIITVEAQAFSQQDALRVAGGVLETAEGMVNRLSEQARQDTVRLAEAELARAEAALRAQRAALAGFRESEQSIDPNRSVATQEGVLAALQGDFASARAEMRGLREFLGPDAPSIRVLQSRIASIESQIEQERANLGRGRAVAPDDDASPNPSSETLNSAVSTYEALSVDLDFHERAYVSALASLESARAEADRQQRYLATVVMPALPDSPTYPQVFLTLLMVFSVCFLVWGILSMFIHIIREHLR